MKKELSPTQLNELLKKLKARFTKNMHRHEGLTWEMVQSKLESKNSIEKLWSLNEMDETGGEPDVVLTQSAKGDIVFYDCSSETPKGRRSLCYDREALESRKDFPPSDSVVDLAKEMGIELLSEIQYRELQNHGSFDTKTSSWLKTPADIRELGGAIFGDFRYDKVFVYHNGAQSYYAARGFRGLLKF